jgi:hypothetical protein
MKWWDDYVAPVIVRLVGMTLLGVGAFLTFKGVQQLSNNSVTDGMAYLGGALLFFFAATIDRFESLKGLGIEAKVRKLDATVVEAKDTLAKLRQVAELASSTAVRLSSNMGRWNAGTSHRVGYELAQEVVRQLRALGSDDRAIADVIKPWLTALAVDVANKVVDPYVAHLVIEHQAIRQAATDLRNRGGDVREIERMEREAFAAETYQLGQLQNGLSQRINADNFPERLLQLVDEAPIRDGGRLQVERQRIVDLGRSFQALRQNLTLENPDPLINYADGV